MIPTPDLQRWQQSITSITALQSELSPEELSTFQSLIASINSNNFEASESGGYIQIMKNAMLQHAKNRLLKAHLTNFVILCEKYFKVQATNTVTTAPVVSPPPTAPTVEVKNTPQPQAVVSSAPPNVASADFEKWQKSIQGIEAAQKDLSPEELSAFQAIKELFNNGNFASNESGGNIQIIKNALSNHSKNRLLRAHLTNFVALCEQYFTNKSVPVEQPQVSAPAPTQPEIQQPQIKQQPQTSTPLPTFGGLPKEDIANWQKVIQGIETAQKELSPDELSAYNALKELFSNCNFEASESGGYIKLIKDNLPQHTKNRLLKVYLTNFIALCEKHFKGESKQVISAPTTSSNADVQHDIPNFQPPTFEPPTIETPTIEPPKVEAPTIEPPTIEQPKIVTPTIEPPTVQPPKIEPPTVEPKKSEEPKKSKKNNLQLILILVAIALLIGGWQIYQNWNTLFGKPKEITLDKTSLLFENINISEQLTATILPEDIPGRNKKLSWHSNDTLVATVSESGVVTAIAYGNAIIIVSAINGLSDSCFISVNDTTTLLSDTLILVNDTVPVAAVETITKVDEKATPVKEGVKEPAKPQQSQTTSTTTSKPVKRSGTLSVTGGTYTGELKDGKPDGMGTLRYNSRTLISSSDPKKRYAEAGQYIVGQFRDGGLLQGKLFDSNNNHIETIIIGGGAH